MKSESCTQPPEATGARDLTAAHAETDARYDKLIRIVMDDEALAQATLIVAENDAIGGWARACGELCRNNPVPILEFMGRAAAWMAERGQCDRCLGITDGDHCAVCELIDCECGEDPLDESLSIISAHDAETMDEKPGGELES